MMRKNLKSDYKKKVRTHKSLKSVHKKKCAHTEVSSGYKTLKSDYKK